MQTNTTAPTETIPHALFGGANLPLVADRDDAPSIDRYSLSLGYDPGGYAEASMGYATEGAYVEYDDHLRALEFERGRSDALQAIADAQTAHIAKLKAEIDIHTAASAMAMEHLRQADALYLPSGASQSDVEEHLSQVDHLGRLAGYALGEIAADVARLSQSEADA